MKYSICEGKDAVIWKMEQNKKREVFCPFVEWERKCHGGIGKVR